MRSLMLAILCWYSYGLTKKFFTLYHIRTLSDFGKFAAAIALAVETKFAGAFNGNFKAFLFLEVFAQKLNRIRRFLVARREN